MITHLMMRLDFQQERRKHTNSFLSANVTLMVKIEQNLAFIENKRPWNTEPSETEEIDF